MKTIVSRTLSGAVFCTVVIGGLLWPYSSLALTLAVTALLSVEFFRIMAGRRYLKEMICVLAASFLACTFTFLHLYCGLSAKFLLLTVLPLLLGFAFMLFDCCDDYDFNTAVFFPILYVALPMSLLHFLTVTAPGKYCGYLMICLLIMIWGNDTFAYLTGMAFGQRQGSRKLFPKISPKKSWVGFAGGTLSTFLIAWAVWAVWGSECMALCHWMAVALIISVVGVAGDLFESLIKRHGKVKDASNLIPGHGGFLDRFDDVLFVVPAVVVYIKLLSIF